MKQRTMLFLRALVVAAPLLFTVGCSEDEGDTAWWLAKPWAPLEWIWAPANMIPDDSTAGGSGVAG